MTVKTEKAADTGISYNFIFDCLSVALGVLDVIALVAAIMIPAAQAALLIILPILAVVNLVFLVVGIIRLIDGPGESPSLPTSSCHSHLGSSGFFGNSYNHHCHDAGILDLLVSLCR